MKTFLALFVSLLIGISSSQAQWTDYPSPLFSNSLLWSVQVVDANNIWAVTTVGNEVIKTTNGGATWTALPVTDPAFTNFYIGSISVIDANTAWLVATNTGAQPMQSRIYKTINGGATWVYQPSPYNLGTDGHVAFANHFFDANYGVILGNKKVPNAPGTPVNPETMEILTTSDGGTTWNVVPSTNLPIGAGTNKGSYYRTFSVVNNTIGYMGIDRQIYKSTDKGITWTKTDPGFPAPTGTYKFSLAFIDANNGLASCNGTLKRTTDGGATWFIVNTTGTWDSYEMVPVPGTASTYISAGRNLGNPQRSGSYITHDSGNTWLTLETTNIHADIHFINPTTGWSGGYGKMYKFNGTTLGTSKEISNSNSYFIYPNPSNGNFQITPDRTHVFSLEVYDLVGNKVMQQTRNSFGKNTVDLSGQKKGIYLLHILSGEQRIIEKIVLQ